MKTKKPNIFTIKKLAVYIRFHCLFLLFFYFKALFINEVVMPYMVFVHSAMVGVLITLLLSIYVSKKPRNVVVFKAMVISALISIALLIIHVFINFSSYTASAKILIILIGVFNILAILAIKRQGLVIFSKTK